MKLKPFDAICFDAFGTLVEIGNPRQAYSKLFKNLGLQNVGLGRQVMTTNADIQDVLTELNIRDIPAEVLIEFQEDLQAEVASIQLYPGVVDMLTHLRTEGYKIWVASNLAPPYGSPLISALISYIDGFSLSYSCRAIKPESTVFMQVSKGLQIPADRILVVGNDPIADIEGARRFGMHAVMVPVEGISMGWFRRVLKDRDASK